MPALLQPVGVDSAGLGELWPAQVPSGAVLSFVRLLQYVWGWDEMFAAAAAQGYAHWRRGVNLWADQVRATWELLRVPVTWETLPGLQDSGNRGLLDCDEVPIGVAESQGRGGLIGVAESQGRGGLTKVEYVIRDPAALVVRVGEMRQRAALGGLLLR